MDKGELEVLIRQLVKEQLGEASGEMKRKKDHTGVIGIRGSSVTCDPFDTGNPKDEVYLTDVVTLEESPRLGCGYMEIVKDKPFAWTLSYDEVDVILDGTLEIVTDTGKIRGSAGDTIYIPKGTSLQFTCPEGERVRFVYVTYPADWQVKDE